MDASGLYIVIAVAVVLAFVACCCCYYLGCNAGKKEGFNRVTQK